MSHCGLLAALTIILYGAPATFLCDSVTLISACSSSRVYRHEALRGLFATAELFVLYMVNCITTLT